MHTITRFIRKISLPVINALYATSAILYLLAWYVPPLNNFTCAFCLSMQDIVYIALELLGGVLGLLCIRFYTFQAVIAFLRARLDPNDFSATNLYRVALVWFSVGLVA